jgi:hypothetical protein
LQYLDENVKAASVQLSDEEVAKVREIAVEADNIPGDRYEPQMYQMLFAETPSL